jgi:hypothetical protein
VLNVPDMFTLPYRAFFIPLNLKYLQMCRIEGVGRLICVEEPIQVLILQGIGEGDLKLGTNVVCHCGTVGLERTRLG